MKKNDSLTYQQAGVDIDAGNKLVEMIKPDVAATKRKGVMGTVGGFGGLFDLTEINCANPVLVSGTDGVGTKLKLAHMLDNHLTIGEDLVAMCVNDILTLGAEPLFFLDYYACGQLNTNQAAQVIKGIANGCKKAGCALIGGETAEMPGMYQSNDYDLAGFVVGVADKTKLIDGSQIKQSDNIIGVASSGPHSNGYSLIRKIIELNNVDLSQDLSGKSIGQRLLEPTTIYTDLVKQLLRSNTQVKGVAHITGGGISENITRVIPSDLSIEINLDSWEMPAIFQWLQEMGNINTEEMLRTFNCGIGLAIIVSHEQTDEALAALATSGIDAWCIGQVNGQNGSRIKYI